MLRLSCYRVKRRAESSRMLCACLPPAAALVPLVPLVPCPSVFLMVATLSRPDMTFYRRLPSTDEIKTLGWYHYDLSRHAAEALLLSNGTDGSYLLRNSNEGPGCFALSVRAKNSVKHFHVTRKDSGYVFGFNKFASLQDFVNHFANQPLLGSDTGTLIVLKCPYPWHVEEPSIYESVRVHTAIQSGRTENDLVPNAPSLGTKEGYLVKQGAIVKNWKQRWFTLNRYDLKYFKDKVCEEPIRTLDLRACSAVQFDYSQDRVNCFCLVFPDRTFYLCAKTGVEADEWIKILRWKLSQISKGR